jgi:hypothetical protein
VEKFEVYLGGKRDSKSVLTVADSARYWGSFLVFWVILKKYKAPVFAGAFGTRLK